MKIPREITLTKGQTTWVDEADYRMLNKHKWHAVQGGGKGGYYAIRWNPLTKKMIKMHRQIMDAPKELDVDHLNGDTLDNRRVNLRICTHKVNMNNQKQHRKLITTRTTEIIPTT